MSCKVYFQAVAKYGVPFSHWTPGLLQKEAIKAGIVTSISVRHVGRILKK
jgi:putative transposase